MNAWLQFITVKLRFDSFLQTIINSLKLIRIFIYPYFIFEELVNNMFPNPEQMDISQEFEIGLAHRKDINQMLRFSDRMDDYEKLSSRFNREDICEAAWSNGKIIAFSWANLNQFDSYTAKYKLQKDEAYLYDAYTSPEYRGKRLAYHLRYHLYKILKTNGKHKFYSISIKTNKPTLKFKKNHQRTNYWLGSAN